MQSTSTFLHQWLAQQGGSARAVKPYWACWGELSLDQDGLRLCGQRIIVPAALRLQVLGQLHTGHQGITKCRQRAKKSVWWPGLQLAKFVRSCSTCARSQAQHAEPLLLSDIPSLPWQRVALDFSISVSLPRGCGLLLVLH